MKKLKYIILIASKVFFFKGKEMIILYEINKVLVRDY